MDYSNIGGDVGGQMEWDARRHKWGVSVYTRANVELILGCFRQLMSG